MRQAPVAPWLKGLGLVALLLTLSGCVSYRLGLVLSWDGSGTINQRLQVDPLLASLARLNLGDLQQQIRQRAERAGGTLDTSEAPSAWTVVIPFKEVAQIEPKLTKFLEDPITQGAAVRSAVQQTVEAFRVEEQNFLVVKSYHLKGVLDLRNLMRIPNSGGILRVETEGLLEAQLQITLPWAPLASNANRTEGNTVTWMIEPDRPNPLDITFLLPNFPGLLLVLGGLIAGSLVLVLRR